VTSSTAGGAGGSNAAKVGSSRSRLGWATIRGVGTGGTVDGTWVDVNINAWFIVTVTESFFTQLGNPKVVSRSLDCVLP
jgi:hypothetical protein